jgi:exodeoxyribonuclease-5
VELSPKQDKAILAVKDWYENSDKQVFRLFGYAGSGKTTLAKHFADSIDGHTLYAAFTGKAASVLQKKGCNASTIHSLIYRLKKEEKGKPPEWELNQDSDLNDADLLIVDEVSMVGPDMGEDVESFGKKILVLGDPMQLPPIEGSGYFTDVQPDFLLDEIHRQAQDNPIIKLATSIRQMQMPFRGKYGESTVQDGMSSDLVMSADQLIVGKNLTRKAANDRARSLLGRTQPLPEIGDKLCCWRNNRRDGFLNGTLWKVSATDTEFFGDPKDFFPPAYVCDLQDEDGERVVGGVQMHREPFTGGEIPFYERRLANEFEYGYALTCHKSQGSQWPHVVILDESWSFRENKWRWLYTAVTRASEKVNICRK